MENAGSNESYYDLVKRWYSRCIRDKGTNTPSTTDTISYVDSIINPKSRSIIQRVNRDIHRYTMTDFGSDDDY